jgi:rare lipoprotein A (peptidoglycan hydrolase)
MKSSSGALVTLDTSGDMMKTKRIFILFILSLVMLFVSTGCQTTAQYYTPGGSKGVARYYAKSYNGKRTSSGAIYNSKKLTAAHPTLPLGIRVKVVNLDNKKSVIVKINDRCEEHEDVFIDLSRQAARKLGMTKKGKANVRISVIK